jgi:hypothetical protein
MAMFTGLLMLTAAQSAATGSATPCTTPLPKEGEQEIVICVEKSDGFRIDPDIMKTDKQLKKQKLKRPERFVDKSCATVGPMGCRDGGGINLMAAALTAAEMARRAVTGGDVGEMFITDPQPDEYQLYLANKREREAREAAAKATADSKAENNSTSGPSD